MPLPPTVNPVIEQKTKRKTGLVLGLLGVVLIGGAAAYFFFWYQKPKAKPAPANTNQNTNTPVTTTNWKSHDQALKDGLVAAAGKVLEVAMTFDRTTTPVFTVDSLKKKNGYASPLDDRKLGYILQVRDAQAQVISTQHFSDDTAVSDPPPQEGQAIGEPVIADQSDITVTLPWSATAADIRISDDAGTELLVAAIGTPEDVDNTPNFHSRRAMANDQPVSYHPKFLGADAQAATGVLNVTFIGDNYTAADLATYHADIDRFTAKLMAIEPYKSRASQIVLHYVDNTTVDLQCVHSPTMNRLITCNVGLANQTINTAGVPNNSTLILVKDSTYGGSGGSAAVSYNGSSGPEVMAHEFGHSFGGLVDEYTLYTTSGGIYNVDYANCYAGTPPSVNWVGKVAATDYTLGCNYPNWYRFAPDSLMLTLSSPWYTVVGQSMINKRIDSYAGIFTDTVYPTSSISSPANGASVSGVVNITTTAADNSGVLRVEFWKDATLMRTDYQSPYSFSWDSSSDTAGTHTLQVKAWDAAGNYGASTPVVVTIGGAATIDTVPPTVSLTAPASAATVTGLSTLTADATDNIAVAGVQFKVDGTNVGSEDTTVPYSYAWNSASVANGTHSLTAVARDAANNTTTSTAVSVTVTNAAVLSVPSMTIAPTANTATFAWTTNLPSTGSVTLGNGLTASDTVSGTTHTVTISGLTKSTKYTYALTATNGSSNAGKTGSFRTKAK